MKTVFAKFSTEAPRTRLINDYLFDSKKKSYLEIGVRCGANFFQVNASRKIGVDPDYFFSKRSLLKAMLKRRNWFFKMYKMESDHFFSKHEKTLQANGLDVVFIDGMHTYQQSLKDAKNALRFLNKDGVVVFHDCNPISEIASQPNLPNEKINWNGDVWKTIFQFRQFSNSFECFTYDTDEGLGVIKVKSKFEEKLLSEIKYSEQIQDLDYNFLNQNRSSVIGLLEFTEK